MATKVVMEALSPTMEEGRLVKWNKNEGDQIKSGDVLAEVETDKAVMELVARGDGVLRKRLANEGDASPVGTLLFRNCWKNCWQVCTVPWLGLGL